MGQDDGDPYTSLAPNTDKGGVMSDYRDVATACAELMVTVGIIEAAVENNDDAPDEVKENFVEKVNATVEHLHSEILEYQQFGEAYDREED